MACTGEEAAAAQDNHLAFMSFVSIQQINIERQLCVGQCVGQCVWQCVGQFVRQFVGPCLGLYVGQSVGQCRACRQEFSRGRPRTSTSLCTPLTLHNYTIQRNIYFTRLYNSKKRILYTTTQFWEIYTLYNYTIQRNVYFTQQYISEKVYSTQLNNSEKSLLYITI